MKRIKVVFLESGTELGGAQVALLNLLRALDRDAIAPEFVSLGFGEGPLPGLVAQMGIPVHALPFARLRNPIATARKTATLVRLLLDSRADVLFCNSGHPFLAGRPAAALAGVPVVWWVHGYFPDDPLKGNWISLFERLLKADGLVANSQYTAAQLQRVFPEQGPIAVLPPPVDSGSFFPLPENGERLRAALALPKQTAIIGNFGRLHPFKGQDVFLRAAKVLQRNDADCHFLLVGGSPYGLAPEYEKGLRSFVKENGLESCTTFLGPRDDLNELVNACDVVVHSSVEPEPWGLVVAEAMSAGRAVIATAGGGPAEMIADGVEGRLVPPREVNVLAEAILGFLKNKSLRTQFGAAARRKAAKWSGSAAAQKLNGLLAPMVGASSIRKCEQV